MSDKFDPRTEIAKNRAPKIGDYEQDMRDFSDPKKVDGSDVSSIFAKKDYADFIAYFHELIKGYQKITKTDPEYDLVFIDEDFGEDETDIVAKLRSLKALRDSADGRYITRAVVRSRNKDFVKLEPNVFSSGIDFELISD